MNRVSEGLSVEWDCSGTPGAKTPTMRTAARVENACSPSDLLGRGYVWAAIWRELAWKLQRG